MDLIETSRNQEYILEVRNVVKTFPGVRALNDVSLQVKKGEIHALVGENGAGKSTLINILGGIHKQDSGSILLNGEKVSFNSAHDANSHGISVVYQELSLIPTLSVAENIFANRQPINKFNIINQKKLYAQTIEMLQMFDIDYISPDMLVKDLSIANQQVVEILKAISFNPKVLILDEPTSSLMGLEIEQLFKNIRILQKKGISFIYISHHLQEIFSIADVVTVLRDGELVTNTDVKDIDENFLVTKMVGRKIENVYGKRNNDDVIGDVLFKAENLSLENKFSNISFEVHKGEILGIAGLIGAGRTEVGRAIFGAEPVQSGKLYLEGKEIKVKNTNEAIRKGIGYLSEDRKSQGLYINFDIKNNLIANHLGDFTRSGFLKTSDIDKFSKDSVKNFNIVCSGMEQLVMNLSGGNQQKVLLGSWFGIKPKLLIVDEPTRGVDIGAKSEIYISLRKLANTGVGIIMISSDLSEVLGISDRIVVMREGQLAGEVTKAEANEEKVIALASGVASNIKEG
ncbi:MAG: sugar ABC transporter ATP-binding protein [Ruminiclostridium sp.]